MNRIELDLNDLARRYHAGESVLSISKSFGVNRQTVNLRLNQLGLEVRNGSTANTIRMSRLTKEERLSLASAAHDAVRGSVKSSEQLANMAKGREACHTVTSEYERTIASWLASLGLVVTPQLAVGPYNVDIAINESRIAVEVFGGNWHASGRHAARYRARVEYLMSENWLPVIIWVVRSTTTKLPQLSEACADYVHTLHQRRCLDKTKPSQEHVIRGDCKAGPTTRYNPDNGAIVLGFNTGNQTRDNYGRYA